MSSQQKRKRDDQKDSTEKKSKCTTLIARVNAKTGIQENNVLEWKRDIADKLVTSRPKYFSDAIRAGTRPTILTPEQIAERYPDAPTRPTSIDLFQLTNEQEEELNNILNARVGSAAAREARRAARLEGMKREWVIEQHEYNARVSTENAVKKAMRDEKLKTYNSYANESIEFIGEIVSTWSENVKRKIKTYRKVLTEVEHEAGTFANTLDDAYIKADWWFVYHDAVEGAIINYQGDNNEDAILNSRDVAIKTLKNCKHIFGDFEEWVQKFQDKLSLCESVGVDLSDAEIRHIFVNNLNDDIFGTHKTNYHSTSLGHVYPRDSFESLKEHFRKEYGVITAAQPETVLKVIRSRPDAKFKGKNKKAKNELSFSLAEQSLNSLESIPEESEPKFSHGTPGQKTYSKKQKKKSKSKGGYSSGIESHSSDGGGKSRDFNPKTPASGQVNYSNDSGSELNECYGCGSTEHGWRYCPKVKDALKSGVLQKHIKTEKAKKVSVQTLPEWTVADIFTEPEITTKTIDLQSEKCCISGVKANEIDFILDHGTESGVANSKDMDILCCVHEEEVLLSGIGTGYSGVTGQSMFGQTRLINGYVGSVLVSQYRIKEAYACVEQAGTPGCQGDHYKLIGRVGTIYEGIEWDFFRDFDRYGDHLLHCTLLRNQAKKLAQGSMAKEKMLTNKISKFYNPQGPVDEANIHKDAAAAIDRAENLHRSLDHGHANEMSRFVESCPDCGVNKSDIEIWRAVRGDHCSGCIQGKLKEHSRVKSTKPLAAEKPGDIGVADLMFVESRGEKKMPVYVHVDVKTKYRMTVALKDKTISSLQGAFDTILNKHKVHKRELGELVFDRESSIVAIEDYIESNSVKLTLKAAGQKVGIAEVDIRHIREKARSVKAGVRDSYGYWPPNQFNLYLIEDVTAAENRIPKPGRVLCPYEEFTGRKVDFVRDFRASWGEPVIVKSPKSIASDLRTVGDWAVVVSRVMCGTGVLLVYVIRTGKVAARLQFKRAKCPEWVIDHLNSISADKRIGVEGDESNPDGLEWEKISTEAPMVTDTVNESEPEEAVSEEEAEALRVIEAREVAAIDDAPNELEGVDIEAVNEQPILTHDSAPRHSIHTRANVADSERLQLERNAEQYASNVVSGWQDPEPGDEGAANFNSGHKRSEANLYKAKETLRKAYLERYGGDENAQEAVNCLIEELGRLLTDRESVNLLYHQAMKVRPEAAEAALLKEVQSCCDKGIWEGILEEDLTQEQRNLILPMMKNYIDKYRPDGSFEKSKVRVLVRGDLQFVIGETEGPVARIESLLIIICIAVVKNLEVFKVDITAAYMNTVMPADVKHRWILLDRDVSKLLLKLNPTYWRMYLRRDGRILVTMKRLMYGFKEAARYWNKTLVDVFVAAGYAQCFKDSCVLLKKEGGNISIVGITVDDCLFAATRCEEWILAQVEMLKKAFSGLTVERGEVLQIVGMRVEFNRTEGYADISQPKYADKLLEFGIDKGAVTPTLADFFYESDDDVLLDAEQQKDYMSINSYLMYGAKRTYPEILPAVVTLSTKYNKATTRDMDKAVRVAQYVFGTKGDHYLRLRPKSLQLIAMSDASDGINANGRGQTGGVVGFQSDTGSWFAFICKTQPIVAQSSGEAELIAVNTVGNYVEWARQLMEEMGFPQESITVFQDSECSLQMLKKGTGSFKRAKHIKIRWFWLKDLVDSGEIVLSYIPGAQLVADILTKAITGARFKYLRALLLGWYGLKTKVDHINAEEACMN